MSLKIDNTPEEIEDDLILDMSSTENNHLKDGFFLNSIVDEGQANRNNYSISFDPGDLLYVEDPFDDTLIEGRYEPESLLEYSYINEFIHFYMSIRNLDISEDMKNNIVEWHINGLPEVSLADHLHLSRTNFRFDSSENISLNDGDKNARNPHKYNIK